MVSRTTATANARCDFCGRESPLPQEWLPSPCPHCGRIFFPVSSRSRYLAIAIGCLGVIILTGFTWWYAL